MKLSKDGGFFSAVRTIFLTLGIAEALDVLLLRPLLIYLSSVIFGTAIGAIAGSFMADVSFWVTVCVIKRRREQAAAPKRAAVFNFSY